MKVFRATSTWPTSIQKIKFPDLGFQTIEVVHFTKTYIFWSIQGKDCCHGFAQAYESIWLSHYLVLIRLYATCQCLLLLVQENHQGYFKKMNIWIQSIALSIHITFTNKLQGLYLTFLNFQFSYTRKLIPSNRVAVKRLINARPLMEAEISLLRITDKLQ